MDIKATLKNLLISLLVSPIIFYLFFFIAKIFGSNYNIGHGEAFIIWVLMAILVNLSMKNKG